LFFPDPTLYGWLRVINICPYSHFYSIIPVAGDFPCRIKGFLYFFVPGQFGPAILVYLKHGP